MNKKIEKLTKIGELSQDEKDFVLKVANLIEQGSEGMQQRTGGYISPDGRGCCAMGAVFKACGMVQKHNGIYGVEGNSFELRDKLGMTFWPRIPFPKGDNEPYAPDGLGRSFVIDVVIFLNDRLGWSFQHIVDYLRDCTMPPPTLIKVKRQKR